jgi:tetrapyrrole methylase family protein/MazG family protein
METLRGENGCPWDKEQTHESLKRYLIEETYETIEALDSGDKMKFADELGDILLQIVFHSQIGKEEGTFSISDVINIVCKKMISRHTHVFGNDLLENSDEVIENWDKIKKDEKGLESHTDVLKAVSRYLPPLMRSFKIQKKAAEVGFDWDSIEGAFEKVLEELNEIKEVYKTQKMGKIEEEIGDLLFSVVNVARFAQVSPEEALNKTINKFIDRFEFIEKATIKKGQDIRKMSLEEMDLLWNQSKIKKNILV